MDWFFKFPAMERNDLREFKKSVDFTFTDFTRSYGAEIESFFEPLLFFLVWFEKFFINTPWPIKKAGLFMLRVTFRDLMVQIISKGMNSQKFSS